MSPLSGHGWCEGLQPPRRPLRGVNCYWVNTASRPFGGGYGGPELFEGRAAVTKGRELRLRFEDGSSLHIPTNDGFYLYRVPDERLIRSVPTALVLRGQGRQLARYPLDHLFFDGPMAGGAGDAYDVAVEVRAGDVLVATDPARNLGRWMCPERPGHEHDVERCSRARARPRP